MRGYLLQAGDALFCIYQRNLDAKGGRSPLRVCVTCDRSLSVGCCAAVLKFEMSKILLVRSMIGSPRCGPESMMPLWNWFIAPVIGGPSEDVRLNCEPSNRNYDAYRI